MKIAATLGIALLLAQARPQPRVTLEQLRRAAQQTGVSEPLEVLSAEKAWAGAEVLLPLVTSKDPLVQNAALRALGRLEDPRPVPQLIALGNVPRAPINGVIAPAIAQSLKGFDPA